MYLLKLLRHQGLPDAQLSVTANAVIISRLLYALPDFFRIDSNRELERCRIEARITSLNQLARGRVFAAAVRLAHPPFIYDGPHNATVHVGDTVRMRCRLLSDPAYHLHWLKHRFIDASYVAANFTDNVRIVDSRHVRMSLLSVLLLLLLLFLFIPQVVKIPGVKHYKS